MTIIQPYQRLAVYCVRHNIKYITAKMRLWQRCYSIRIGAAPDKMLFHMTGYYPELSI